MASHSSASVFTSIPFSSIPSMNDRSIHPPSHRRRQTIRPRKPSPGSSISKNLPPAYPPKARSHTPLTHLSSGKLRRKQERKQEKNREPPPRAARFSKEEEEAEKEEETYYELPIHIHIGIENGHLSDCFVRYFVGRESSRNRTGGHGPGIS
jgi:type IV secretory pathway VirB10-like protein